MARSTIGVSPSLGFAFVVTAPGIVIVAAAWILDPATCAKMAFGAPRVAQKALVELHHRTKNAKSRQ
jgi:hypothetical protein